MKTIRILAVTGVLLSLFTSNAFAAQPHAGGNHTSTMYTYTQAYAKIKTPTYPATYYPSFSTAYTMLKGPSFFAQVGWIKENEPEMNDTKYVWQYYDWSTMANPQTQYGTYGPAQDSSHTYNTYRSGNTYFGYVDATLISSHAVEQNATGYEFFEEIENYNAAFAGTSSGHAVFSNLQVVESGNVVFSPYLSWVTDPEATLYTGSYTADASGSSFEIKDNRY